MNEKNNEAMEKFYFTYGTSPAFPFQGGWTLIYATDLRAAQRVFKAHHPDRDGCGILNCADYYGAEWFEDSEEFRNGNLGVKCHEILVQFSDIESLADRDDKLTQLWEIFSEIPMNPDTEQMELGFLHFPAGTHREEIWKWFDQRYSKGIGYLLYADGLDHAVDLANLAYRRSMCEDCDNDGCGYYVGGICGHALIHGQKAAYDDHRGCLGYVEKPTVLCSCEKT